MTFQTLFPGSCLALLAASALAQTPPCFGTNDQNTFVSAGTYGYLNSGPNTWAWQITPSTPLVVEAGQIYTGNQSTSQVGSFMTVEIYDESPAGLPGNRLAGGTWRIIPTTCWQGANLDNPVVLQAATNYWIALTEPGWSVVPVEPGGVRLPHSYRLGGVGPWTTPVQVALKSRLFCNLLDGQGAASFGYTCVSAAGKVGSLFANEPPSLGNAAFRLEGSGFSPGTIAFLVTGLTQAFPSIPVPGTAGCWQNTDATFTVVGTTGTGNVRQAAASGHAQFNFPLPSDPSFAGFYFASQMAALDVGSTAPLPFVTSNAMQITMF